MLDIFFRILSVIGIILLVLLILVIVLLGLVLFFPISYDFWGTKQEEIHMKAKAKWLLGFFRVNYVYPEPAKLTVKVLWLTLYETFIPGKNTTGEENSENNDVKNRKTKAKVNSLTETNQEKNFKTLNTKEEPSEAIDITESTAPDESNEDMSGNGKILKKIEQIKYTILNLCDKIEKIWENINYYVGLLKEENTKALFRHIILRVGNILKSIRPRQLKADIVFGTGSPDTTGYAYAVYGMLTAVLGPKFIVVPDFEQSVFKGELQFSGHITIWVLLINGLKLLFDKKLHRFIDKVKTGLPQQSVDSKQENSKQEQAQTARKEDNK